MAGIKANRQQELRSFLDLCERARFEPEPFQIKIAGGFFGPEMEEAHLGPSVPAYWWLCGTRGLTATEISG